jgi:hypothetical protein
MSQQSWLTVSAHKIKAGAIRSVIELFLFYYQKYATDLPVYQVKIV